MNKGVEEYRLRIFNKIGIKIKKGSRVLDIGCGDGYDSLYFSSKGADSIGIDVIKSPVWRKLEKDNKNLFFKKTNGKNIPFKNGFFDIVYIKDVLHHVKSPQKILLEAIRLTKNNGQLIIIEANRYNPLFYLHMTLMLKHEHFNRNYFKKVIESVSSQKNLEYFYFEAHVFPFPSLIRKLCYALENTAEKLIFWQPFLSYNAVKIIKKNHG